MPTGQTEAKTTEYQSNLNSQTTTSVVSTAGNGTISSIVSATQNPK
jgi:hypothetical protein